MIWRATRCDSSKTLSRSSRFWVVISPLAPLVDSSSRSSCSSWASSLSLGGGSDASRSRPRAARLSTQIAG